MGTIAWFRLCVLILLGVLAFISHAIYVYCRDNWLADEGDKLETPFVRLVGNDMITVLLWLPKLIHSVVRPLRSTRIYINNGRCCRAAR